MTKKNRAAAWIPIAGLTAVAACGSPMDGSAVDEDSDGSVTHIESAVKIQPPPSSSVATRVAYGGSEWWSLDWCSGDIYNMKSPMIAGNRQIIDHYDLSGNVRCMWGGVFRNNTNKACVIDFDIGFWHPQAQNPTGTPHARQVISLKFAPGKALYAPYCSTELEPPGMPFACSFYRTRLYSPNVRFQTAGFTENFTEAAFYCPGFLK